MKCRCGQWPYRCSLLYKQVLEADYLCTFQVLCTTGVWDRDNLLTSRVNLLTLRTIRVISGVCFTSSIGKQFFKKRAALVYGCLQCTMIT